MDLIVFQCDRGLVLDALRRGEIDYLENVSEASASTDVQRADSN